MLLTVDEVARRLRKSTSWVTRMCREGILPAFKVGRSWRIREVDLTAWMRAQGDQGGEE